MQAKYLRCPRWFPEPDAHLFFCAVSATLWVVLIGAKIPASGWLDELAVMFAENPLVGGVIFFLSTAWYILRYGHRAGPRGYFTLSAVTLVGGIVGLVLRQILGF